GLGPGRSGLHGAQQYKTLKCFCLPGSDNLRHHLRIMHPNGPAPRVKLRPPPITWLCHTCGKTFTHRSRLKTHEQIHTGIKPCQCPLCPKAYMSFSCKSLLSLHLQKHTGERPHLCHLCGRKFSRKQQLQSSGACALAPARPCSFPCSVCGRSFRFPSLLSAHMTVHSDERPFTCDLCPRSFRRVSHLKRHVEGVHPDGRPRPTHICPICGTDQKFRSKLERHLLVHSGERPYSCDR
uniref:C2H2-type domain-containing protein n=1 Tax=Periophthalmus magnuspinnatus TaxID=409849 RepID=A0A3B4A2A0_9GOBI